MQNYRTIRIPEGLVDGIIEIINDLNKLGYRSHTEFIIDAIRRRMEQLRKKFEVEKNDVNNLQFSLKQQNI